MQITLPHGREQRCPAEQMDRKEALSSDIFDIYATCRTLSMPDMIAARCMLTCLFFALLPLSARPVRCPAAFLFTCLFDAARHTCLYREGHALRAEHFSIAFAIRGMPLLSEIASDVAERYSARR